MSFELKFFVCRHVSIWGFQNPVCLSVPREKKSPGLRQYQSYISNWYINGKVFTSTTEWKPKNLIFFFKKVRILTFDEELKSPWLRQYQSYISNWYVNRKVFTSTTTWEPRNFMFFFSKKFEIEFDLYFDLCWRAEIIQAGLNMHLCVDIGDASSSLWGSTSSFILCLIACALLCSPLTNARNCLSEHLCKYWWARLGDKRLSEGRVSMKTFEIMGRRI